MLIDHRTYRILPGRIPAQLELYGKLAYPVQLRHMGEPHYYLVAESGDLNTLVHGWIYESAADREQKRAKMAADPEWQVYLKKVGELGLLEKMQNRIVVPTDFSPKPG